MPPIEITCPVCSYPGSLVFVLKCHVEHLICFKCALSNPKHQRYLICSTSDKLDMQYWPNVRCIAKVIQAQEPNATACQDYLRHLVINSTQHETKAFRDYTFDLDDTPALLQVASVYLENVSNRGYITRIIFRLQVDIIIRNQDTLLMPLVTQGTKQLTNDTIPDTHRMFEITLTEWNCMLFNLATSSSVMDTDLMYNCYHNGIAITTEALETKMNQH